MLTALPEVKKEDQKDHENQKAIGTMQFTTVPCGNPLEIHATMWQFRTGEGMQRDEATLRKGGGDAKVRKGRSNIEGRSI
jgi:hypothetical protein